MPNGEENKKVAWKVASELLNANHFITLGTNNPTIYRYNQSEGIYEGDGEEYIRKRVQDNFEDKSEISNHLINEILGHIERTTLDSPDTFSESNPHLVLENCLFNLDKMRLEDFTPDYHALAKMPVKFDPSTDYKKSKFWTFINEILSPEDVEGVQEEVGAILRKEYLTKKFSIYEGDTDTGKSTLLNVIQALLGEDSISNLSLQQIASKERFYLSKLFGKMANIRDDMPRDIIKTAGALKEVTGRSRIVGEYKFQNPFEFQNHAYIIVSCNELPPFEDDDLAVFNRIKLRRFKNRYGGHAEPDRELERKLTTPEELSAVLNWGLEGLERLKKQGWNFSNNENEVKTRDYYKRRSDPLWGFVEDCVDTGDSEAFVAKEELFNACRQYCKGNDLPEINKDYFYKHLGDKVTVRSERRGDKGKQKHVFVGIKLDLNKKKGDYHDYQDPEDDGSQGSQGSLHLSATTTTALCGYCGNLKLLKWQDNQGNLLCEECKEQVASRG